MGTAATADWLPQGSLIRIKTANGPRVYLAVDKGSAVQEAKAAKKSAKNSKQKKEQVIDFCAPSQHWKDRLEAEIYHYVGTTPFEKLTQQQKEQTIAYAHRFTSIR